MTKQAYGTSDEVRGEECTEVQGMSAKEDGERGADGEEKYRTAKVARDP